MPSRKEKMMKLLTLCFTTYTKLDLSGLGLDDDIVEIIVELLKKNNAVKEINLSNNKITNKGAIRLADVLYENDTLEILWLSNNYILSTGAEFLAGPLSYRPTQFRLFINGNNIDFGSYSINNAMIQNPNFKALFDKN